MQAAIGGQSVTNVYEGEKFFALTVRWQEAYRQSVEAIREITVEVRDTDQAERIKLERAQAEAQQIGLHVQLMALEVQRRQALLAAGTLTPFEPDPTETIVA